MNRKKAKCFSFATRSRARDSNAQADVDNDIAIIGLSMNGLSKSEVASVGFLNLDREIEYMNYHPRLGDTVLVRGYPNALGGIRYNKRKVVNQGHAFEGVYFGRVSGYSDLHAGVTCDSLTVPDRNGMSGSPVFWHLKHKDGVEAVLIGMYLMSAPGCSNFRFLGRHTILSAILDTV